MRIIVTGAFERNLKKLSKQDADDAIDALQLFMTDHRAQKLNFEKVISKKSYFTIRANRPVRLLLRQVGEDLFEAVAVGNHDFIYQRYFRK